MKFILCVPTLNEKSIILETLKTLSLTIAKIPSDVAWQIVVADNGSTDGTSEVVSSADLVNVGVVSIKQKGKGIALRTVAMQSDCDFFGFIDADLSASPEFILPMLERLIKNQSDVVVGSRFVDTTGVHRGFFRTFTSRVFNILQFMILGLKVRDTQCGLKLMNKKGIEVFRQCREDSWFFDLEFLSLSVRQNLRIDEIPVFWEEFRYKDRVAKLKVVRDGFSAIVAMFRIRHRINKKHV